MQYVADENGYRVTNMLAEPIGEGPEENKMGRAIVQSLISGVETQYAIQAKAVEDPEGRTVEDGSVAFTEVTDEYQIGQE